MGRTNGKPLRGIRALRKRTGLNQFDFWTRVGITQSCGSRYEGGRRIPKPVRILLDLAYSDDPDIAGRALARLRSGLTVNAR